MTEVVFHDNSDEYRKHHQYMHHLNNGYKVSVVYGCNLYCTPRCSSFNHTCTCPKGDDFNIESYEELEVAVLSPENEIVTICGDKDYNDVYGYQTRSEVMDLIKRAREL